MNTKVVSCNDLSATKIRLTDALELTAQRDCD